MNISVIAASGNEHNSANNRVLISKAARTAECADQYAHELRSEFNELLMEAIRKTDAKVAGRFVSLLNELCFMTSMTKQNISKGGGR